MAFPALFYFLCADSAERVRIRPTHMDSPERESLFHTTHWTMVLEAAGGASAGAEAALEELCRIYWYPLYAYARKLGHSKEEAEDSTQGFFAKLLEKNYLAVVSRDRGRFRGFLLTSFKRFLHNEWDRESAVKRGGGKRPISFDEMDAAERFRAEPRDLASPDLLFEKRWALTLIREARLRLREEYERAGKQDRFAFLEGHLPGQLDGKPYAVIADALSVSEGAVKVEVHRMKKSYRDLLRSEVAKTVARPEEIDDEIAYLMEVLGR